MKGVGLAGFAGIVGGNSTALATGQGEHSGDDGESDNGFAAVRIGNLVPDIAMGPPGRGPPEDTPGRGPPVNNPGRGSQLGSASTALDVYVGKPPDGNPTIGGVSYPTFGPGPADAYLQVPASEYDLAVTKSGSTDPVLEESAIELDPGVRYTALAVGRSSPESDGPGLQSVVLMDANSEAEATPPEDLAEASFVHASPDAGPVDILVDGNPVLPGVEFGDASHYVGVPPGEYTVEIQANGETLLTLTRELVAATRITLYVVGLANVDDSANEQGLSGLSTVATVDGLNPLPHRVLTR